MLGNVDKVFEDVTGSIYGLPGFQVMSMDRKVVAIALLQCVERGLVTLDTIPTDLLPELSRLQVLRGWTEKNEPILEDPQRLPTVRELLSHQSGISVDISEPMLLKWNEYQGRKTTSQNLIYPMMFSPRDGWAYSTGMDWVGHLISRLNGNISLGDYFEKYIFGPLGLQNTTFEPLEDPKFRDRLTATHLRQPEGSLKVADVNAGAQYAKSGHHNGGGGLWSTASDLCQLLRGVFLDEHHSGLLTHASVREIYRPCLDHPEYLGQRVEKMKQEKPMHINILPQIPTDVPKSFGLGVAINLADLDTGLSAGSFQWSGFPNCYWASHGKCNSLQWNRR
ncbi:hypothetical protein Z517_07607 [Fonsecaea pedrosoi CBS 271.37]|uniref:Unplaced genomic scaffold supercont1.5, whole genome shotgun sequence n=1 Tax=Fonsecaea pedrosoi CBS 271.37 TaxID=1442368 RepID=A0A0D2GZ91_9EURO|nr:uncharacterized protein Z517_07607 [Fonsecaea pedrosoi CBS 271.37]KIW77774.1 hypothetical protein Z517_07607 [Fonsecaea pedrosoi CBS 271.37]